MFKKCGFYNSNDKNQSVNQDQDEDTNFEEEANQDLQTLSSLKNHDFGNFTDFANADDAVITSSELTLEIINQQIINEIRQDNDKGDSETEIDEPEEIVKQATLNDAKNSIEVIKNYVLNHGNTNKNLILIDKLENNIIVNHLNKSKQQLITNYLCKSN